MTRLAAVVVLALGAAAWADVIPPSQAECQGKAAGVACTQDDGAAGTCQASKCWRNDYSDGPPPKQVEVDCMKCLPGQVAPPAADAGSAAPPKPKGSCAAVPGLTLAGLAVLVAAFTRKRR
jgi:hypothetical protein